MPRSKNKVAARARRKKILKKTKGYWGARKNVWTIAKNAYEKGQTYAYRDRKNKKRTFRALWIQRINAAVRAEGMSYSEFMGKLKDANIDLNRKVLADLAMNEPAAFKEIVNAAAKAKKGASSTSTAAAKEVKAEAPKTPKAEKKEAPASSTSEEKPKAEKKAAPKTEPKSKKADSSSDDLKVINKIGPAFEKRLNALGVHSYADLAGLTDAKIEEYEEKDSMTSYDQWQEWIVEAKILAK